MKGKYEIHSFGGFWSKNRFRGDSSPSGVAVKNFKNFQVCAKSAADPHENDEPSGDKLNSKAYATNGMSQFGGMKKHSYPPHRRVIYCCAVC